MSTAASDDLIARVRAYLTSLEPPVPADDLSDDEVGEFVLLALTWMEVEEGMPHQLLPERFRPPPELPAMPPIKVEVDRENLTARVGADTRYAQFLEWGTVRTMGELMRAGVMTQEEVTRAMSFAIPPPATPSEPPPRPH
jgi:hypothetical protein